MEFVVYRWRLRIPSFWLGLAAFIGCMALWSFVAVRSGSKSCERIIVSIQNEQMDAFITPEEIATLANTCLGEDKTLKGRPWPLINLRVVEQAITNHNFVDKAHAWRDHSGAMHVDVWQMKPILRLVLPGEHDQYLDTNGHIFLTSQHHSARVLVADGEGVRILLTNDVHKEGKAQQLFKFFCYLLTNPFYRALIGQVTVDGNGQITLYPMVGNQAILLGQPDDFERRMRKLEAFYAEIVPTRGWDKYHTVNVQFENQIVCE